jgi:Cu(I)/Ag(I) efflux system membrane fusion protein
MFADHYYFLAAIILLLVALILLPLARGRRFMIRWLPGLTFFALLLGVAEMAFAVGQRAAPSGGGDSSAIYTCSMHPQVQNEGSGLCPICHMELVPRSAAGADAGESIKIDPAVVHNMGVRLQRLAAGPVTRTLQAFGEARIAEDLQQDVALKFEGYIETLHADTLGMSLPKDAPLFHVYSPDLLVAQQELIAAHRSGDARLLAAARSKLLLWDIPAAEIDRLQQLNQPERTVVWKTTSGGTLLERNIVRGAPAMKNQVLLRLADLSVLWLDVQVAERDLPFVALGQAGVATFDASPGNEIAGEVVFVTPTLDRKSRTATVRLQVANPDGLLKPGMFARVKLKRTLTDEAILAPKHAILDTGSRQLAWVAVGRGEFAPRILTLGASADGGMVEVLAGLETDDLLVISGQFLIDAESNLRGGIHKFSNEALMTDGELPPPPPIELDPQQQRQIDALAEACLRVTAEFALDHVDLAGWRDMRRISKELAAAADEDLHRLAGKLAERLELAPEGIEELRVSFKAVSQSLIHLLERARPSSKLGTTLFVHHCPMVEADWLQLDDATRNPYDTSMLQCGEVRRTLATADSSAKAGGR